MALNVKFISVKSQATYDALETKDALALYWIQDSQRVYKGDKLYGVGLAATTEFAGLMSVEDKAKLDALVASGGGLGNLVPIDGTIVLTDTSDGSKSIGVAVAPDAGNALVSVEGGLFVPTVVVPEYAIEKQATAEEGYAASYKLKKTVNGEVSYMGDTINIARDMVLQSATLEIVTEADVPYAGAVVGDPYIKMTFNDANASALYIPVKGLVDTYSAGDGISIENGVVSVKLATETHGLVAVNGELSINLATKYSDGAMSKEDKKVLDAIPSVYVARKYEISNTPKGTLVNYGEDEIRIMCPTDATYTKQSVGAGGDANTYYVTLKTYVPSDDAVGYIEHLGNQTDSEILTDLKTDEYGRKYQPTWLGVAKFDESAGVWSYYGANSTEGKYVGWDYRIDWYDASNVMIASDSVRINLSNEACHNNIRPYYMANYATSNEVEVLKEAVADLEQGTSWEEW